MLCGALEWSGESGLLWVCALVQSVLLPAGFTTQLASHVWPHHTTPQTWFLSALTFLTSARGMWAGVRAGHSAQHCSTLNRIIADSAGRRPGGTGGNRRARLPSLVRGYWRSQSLTESGSEGGQYTVNILSRQAWDHKYFQLNIHFTVEIFQQYFNNIFSSLLVHSVVHRRIFLKIAWSWLGSPQTSRTGWLPPGLNKIISFWFT